MPEKEYDMVKIGRLDGEDTPNYEIRGLPAGADFRNGENYDRLTASWLKLNGIGISVSEAMEISEHGETIKVDQAEPGGSAKLRT